MGLFTKFKNLFNNEKNVQETNEYSVGLEKTSK